MSIFVKEMGSCDYEEVYDLMRFHNEKADSIDEIWLLEHHPVYTLGLSKHPEHLLNIQDIPVIETDRGGQVTYHGPGQLIAYLLIDLNQRSYKVKKLVSLIEESIIDFLKSLNVDAERKKGSPGVYVNGEKIAALGIRVRNGKTYHGLALNVDMDLSPFDGINPCGYEGLKCTQISDHVDSITLEKVKKDFPSYLIKNLDSKSTKISNVA